MDHPNIAQVFDGGATACGGADLNWDSDNCGRCGNICPLGTFCVDGVCEGGGGE